VPSTARPRFQNLLFSLCSAVCLAGAPWIASDAVADDLPFTTLPGEATSPWTRISQREADEAFESGDFERAHRIYRKKLAPKGDKYAHYMLGHLNENGLGVPRDLPRALAWYALAAERGSDGARASAERLTTSLGAEEQERADGIFAELLERYGDRPLLVKAILRDERELRRRTGSRLGTGIKPMQIIAPDGRTVSGDLYYDALKARIEFRRQWLGGTVTLGEFELIDTPEENASDNEEPREIRD
jgi:TPR repeat protein